MTDIRMCVHTVIEIRPQNVSWKHFNTTIDISTQFFGIFNLKQLKKNPEDREGGMIDLLSININRQQFELQKPLFTFLLCLKY